MRRQLIRVTVNLDTFSGPLQFPRSPPHFDVPKSQRDQEQLDLFFSGCQSKQESKNVIDTLVMDPAPAISHGTVQLRRDIHTGSVSMMIFLGAILLFFSFGRSLVTPARVLFLTEHECLEWIRVIASGGFLGTKLYLFCSKRGRGTREPIIMTTRALFLVYKVD